MFRILILQVVVAISSMANIGAADWLFQRGRIRQRFHSLWVSASSTAICLPVLTWTSNVFLGYGLVSQVLVCILGTLMFFWVYCRLRKVPATENVEDPVTSAEVQG
jgi:hypothetical protein